MLLVLLGVWVVVVLLVVEVVLVILVKQQMRWQMVGLWWAQQWMRQGGQCCRMLRGCQMWAERWCR
jgi:hypothetical protein